MYASVSKKSHNDAYTYAVSMFNDSFTYLFMGHNNSIPVCDSTAVLNQTTVQDLFEIDLSPQHHQPANAGSTSMA